MVRAMIGTGQALAETGAESAEGALDKSPLYLRIRDVLAEAIAAGRLPKGALLLEGPVATLFSSTRTPVRQAFCSRRRGRSGASMGAASWWGRGAAGRSGWC